MASERRTMLSSCLTVILKELLEPETQSRCLNLRYSPTIYFCASDEILGLNCLAKQMYRCTLNHKLIHRGEAVLRINCETFDTLRTKESKEIIETAKINNIQQKCKFSSFKIYRLGRIMKWRKWNHENTTNSHQTSSLR